MMYILTEEEYNKLVNGLESKVKEAIYTEKQILKTKLINLTKDLYSWNGSPFEEPVKFMQRLIIKHNI